MTSEAARLAAALSLGADLVAAEVTRAFRAAGVRSILLRGPSIARHLYGPGESRGYADADFLVPSAVFAKAEETLAERGFAHSAVLGQHPDDRPQWSRTWKRAKDGGNVDLHRTVVGIRADPEEAWALLSERTEPVEVARTRLAGLDLEATAVVVALHAAHHGPEVAQPLDDLARAIECLPFPAWEHAAALAGRLAATPAFAAGLRLLPAGSELADRLGLPHETSAEVLLRSASAPPTALGFEWLTHVPGFRAKARLVARKLVPDAEFMRAWSPLAGRYPRAGLAAAYLWRPVWLALHAPSGYRAWRRAHKSVV
jgi:hypothetical protein